MRNATIAMFTLIFLAASTGWAEEPKKPAAAEAGKAAAPAAAEAKKPAAPLVSTYGTFAFPVMKVGDTIRELPLKTLEGKELDMMSLAVKGVPMVVFFTNSTCAACRSEAALLASLKADLKDKMILVGILTDLSDKGFTSLEKSVQESATFLHDPEFKSPPSFGFDFTPALVVIKNGKVVDTKAGYNPARDRRIVAELVTKNL